MDNTLVLKQLPDNITNTDSLALSVDYEPNNKKPKLLSATSLRNMASKHDTRTQTAAKASCSSKPYPYKNPEPNTLSDQHNMLSEPNNVLTEDYSFFIKTYRIINFP